MSRIELPVAIILGVATGSLVAGAITIGEAQARSAAGGAVRGIGVSDIALVAPQWATVVALATALIVAGVLAAAWELTRRRGHRAFWIASALPLVLVAVAGTALATEALDPGRRTPATELLSGASHSPFLLATLLAVAFVSTRPRGRLEG